MKKRKIKLGDNKFRSPASPFPTHLYINGGRSLPVSSQHGFKTDTTCCALAIYSLNEHITDEELDYFIEKQKEEAKLKWESWSRVSGETCMMVVTVNPLEPRLESKLIKRGFKNVHDFSRRTGYPPIAKCKLWVLNVKEIEFKEPNRPIITGLIDGEYADEHFGG